MLPNSETRCAFQVDVSGCDLSSCSPASLYLCAGPDASLDYDAACAQVRLRCYLIYGCPFFFFLLLGFLEQFLSMQDNKYFLLVKVLF